MAALDFPASPAIGDKYPVPAVTGQPQYTYDGVKWTTVGAQVTTAAPATALPLMDAATAVVGTATKYAREDHVHPRIPAAPVDALAYSGLQFNGSMSVSQELGDTGRSVQGYICDGWLFVKTGTAVETILRLTDPLFGACGFSNLLYGQAGTAQPTMGAGDYYALFHYIEGYRISRLAWGTGNAQPITLGFWTSHSKPGLYSGSIRNGAYDRSYVFTYTQNTAYTHEYKTITIPGCPDGVWASNNTPGMRISLAIALGTTNSSSTVGSWTTNGSALGATAQVNCVSTTTDLFRLTGFVVLPGIAAPTAAQSPLIMRPYDQELMTCKRYYAKTATSVRFYAPASNALHDVPVYWPVEMRATPTPATGTATTGNNIVPGYTVSSIDKYHGRFEVQGGSVGDAYAFQVPVALDARL